MFLRGCRDQRTGVTAGSCAVEGGAVCRVAPPVPLRLEVAVHRGRVLAGIRVGGHREAHQDCEADQAGDHPGGAAVLQGIQGRGEHVGELERPTVEDGEAPAGVPFDHLRTCCSARWVGGIQFRGPGIPPEFHPNPTLHRIRPNPETPTQSARGLYRQFVAS